MSSSPAGVRRCGLSAEGRQWRRITCLSSTLGSDSPSAADRPPRRSQVQGVSRWPRPGEGGAGVESGQLEWVGLKGVGLVWGSKESGQEAEPVSEFPVGLQNAGGPGPGVKLNGVCGSLRRAAVCRGDPPGHGAADLGQASHLLTPSVSSSDRLAPSRIRREAERGAAPGAGAGFAGSSGRDR